MAKVTVEGCILLLCQHIERKYGAYYAQLARSISILSAKGFVQSNLKDRFVNQYYLMPEFKSVMSELIHEKRWIIQPYWIQPEKLPQAKPLFLNQFKIYEWGPVYHAQNIKLGDDYRDFLDLVDSIYDRKVVFWKKNTIEYILQESDTLTQRERHALISQLKKEKASCPSPPPSPRLVTSGTDCYPIDVLITSASWEDRCRGTLYHEQLKPYRYKYAFIFIDVPTYDLRVFTNQVFLERQLISKKLSLYPPKIIECDFNNVRDAIFKFQKSCEEIGIKLHGMSVLFDYTTFTKALFLPLIDQLVKDRNEVIGVYSEYGKLSNDGNLLSKGLREVTPLLFFEGAHKNNKPELLIIFGGHESERAELAYENIDPARTLFYIGKKISKERYMEKLNITIKNNQRFITDKTIEKREVNLWKPFDVYGELERVYTQYSGMYNISILSLGPKVEYLGTLPFVKNHPDVRLYHTVPLEYNKSYSKGIGPLHQTIIPSYWFRERLDDYVLRPYV
jgi:hypothetical protein